MERSIWRRTMAWLGLGGSAAVHRRVRLTLYIVVLLVAAIFFWQTRQFARSESVRLSDSEIIRVAADQNAEIQRMNVFLARLRGGDGAAAGNINGLSESVSQGQALAASLDGLLARQGVWQVEGRPQLRTAIFAWQDQRERVWYRAQILLGLAEPPDSETWRAAAGLLHTELDAFVQTIQALVDELQLAAQARAHAMLGQFELAENLMIGLLLLITLSVAEPLVAFVRLQGEDLARQSAETQRLALVAQRTSNWVAVVDRRRRVLWCNEAFLRGRGLPLHEVLGETPRLLRPNAGNDAAEIERLLTELDYGLGVRAEIMCDAPDGREIWLDVDYQPIQDAAGRLSGYTLVASDITERVNQRSRMRALLDALPAGVVQQSANGVVIDCNLQAQEMLGMPRGALVGQTRLVGDDKVVRADLTPYPPDDRPVRRTLRTGQGLRGELLGLMRSEGELRWHMINTEPVRDAAGHLTGVISCMVDVTQQREQQLLLTLAIEGASLGMWQWDIASGQMSCNDRLLALYGYEREELGMHVSDWNQIIHPEDLAGWVRAVQANLRDSRQPLHWEMRIRHGSSARWIWLMYGGTVVARDADGRALRMAGICYDINAQKELEEQLRKTARTDTLTSLPNRFELLGRIDRAIQRAKNQPSYSFAVLYMDFDRFKQVNDTLGHSVGDDLLRQIAQRLQDSLRPGDAFVQTSDFRQMAARIGGDEFVVLLDDIRGDLDAQVVAARLLETLAEPYQVGSHRINSTASIGIVTASHMSDDPDSVLRDADIAMYEAKRQGRGRYEMFEPSMRKRVHDDVGLENDLREALDKGELHVAYQPMIDLRSGRLAGVEALARWQHPVRGAVSPLTFIPVAEACGMIRRIGEFVLMTACRELLQLRNLLGDRGPETVSVNLSRAQLREPGFSVRLQDQMYASGLAPGQLMLEVTESLAAQDESVQTTLREIRRMGVSLSLDDFGTGYSSLSCLHELPVNQVKIDRSFVSQALHSDYHRVMIEATIRMAHTLGLQTVAEGIETPEQAALMTALGCDKGQGFLYSRPLTARDLEPWAVARHAAGSRAVDG